MYKKKGFKGIVLYTQKNCPQCRMVHMLLDKKPNLQYEECQDLGIMQAAGVRHTPAAEINGQIFQGKALIDYIKTTN